jgi:hypothetical protein
LVAAFGGRSADRRRFARDNAELQSNWQATVSTLYNQDRFAQDNMQTDYRAFADGNNPINIKPSKRGTFTAAAKRHGKSVQAFASQVLANKGNYSPAMVKKANFARNAASWHADGNNNWQLGNEWAWLDDGEVLNTPQGVVQIPEQGQPTDSNYMYLPQGTQVFSDKLKVPGTKKTFAQVAKSLTPKGARGNDMYAANADKLNELNSRTAMEGLFALQGEVADKTNKYACGNKKYDDGNTPKRRPVEVSPWSLFRDWYQGLDK